MKDWNERGFLLLETLLSLPILVFLLTMLGGIVLWMGRCAYMELADWELESSMGIVMNRLTEDINWAESVECYKGSKGYDKVKISAHIDGVKGKNERFPLKAIDYMNAQNDEYHGHRIVYMSPDAPLTGNSILGKVLITDFDCERIAEDLVSVRLSGKSLRSMHEYTLSTVVHIEGK